MFVTLFFLGRSGLIPLLLKKKKKKKKDNQMMCWQNCSTKSQHLFCFQKFSIYLGPCFEEEYI